MVIIKGYNYNSFVFLSPLPPPPQPSPLCLGLSGRPLNLLHIFASRRLIATSKCRIVTGAEGMLNSSIKVRTPEGNFDMFSSHVLISYRRSTIQNHTHKNRYEKSPL